MERLRDATMARFQVGSKNKSLPPRAKVPEGILKTASRRDPDLLPFLRMTIQTDPQRVHAIPIQIGNSPPCLFSTMTPSDQSKLHFRLGQAPFPKLQSGRKERRISVLSCNQVIPGRSSLREEESGSE